MNPEDLPQPCTAPSRRQVTASLLSSGCATAYPADLNGNGKTDLLAANAVSLPDLQFSVSVFLNHVAGSFSSAGTSLIRSGAGTHLYVYPPTLVDLNSDRKLDLPVFGSGQLGLGNGDGSFTTAAPRFPLPASPDSYSLPQISLVGNSEPSLVFFRDAGVEGCGSNGNGAVPAAQTPAGSYNFTVTASSGGLQAQTAYTLVVQ
jgi:hypothetical protein